MRAWLLLLSLVLIISSIQAQAKKKKEDRKSGLEKVIESVFMPKPQPTPRPHRVIHIVRPSKGKKPSKEKMFVVAPEWMAHYWELEDEWDYEIPDDNEIEYHDGRYHVPLLVFKHYQDMLNTPHRVDSH